MWKRASTPSEPVVQAPSLGKQLHALQAALRRHEDELQRQRIAEVERLREAERTVIRRFFNVVKTSVTHDIRNGRLPIQVLIPREEPFNTAGWGIASHILNSGNIPSTCRHPDMIEEFFDWAIQNGMRGRIVYREINGFGRFLVDVV